MARDGTNCGSGGVVSEEFKMKSLWCILLAFPVLGRIWEYASTSDIPTTPNPAATISMMAAVLSLAGYRWFKCERRRRRVRANLATVLEFRR